MTAPKKIITHPFPVARAITWRLSWDNGQACYSHTAGLRLPEGLAWKPTQFTAPTTSHGQPVPLAWPRAATTQMFCVPLALYLLSTWKETGQKMNRSNLISTTFCLTQSDLIKRPAWPHLQAIDGTPQPELNYLNLKKKYWFMSLYFSLKHRTLDWMSKNQRKLSLGLPLDS